jgi:Phage integrase, N-terminal SAM-like domain
MTSLRTRMTEDMQTRNLAVHTQNTYLLQVALFARHFNKSPELLGPEQIRTYQVYLTNEKKLSTSSILIAISALRFLYKVTLKKTWAIEDIIPAPKKPQRLPIILSPEEVIQFLAAVISEAVALTPPAIDSKPLRRLHILNLRGHFMGPPGSQLRSPTHAPVRFEEKCLPMLLSPPSTHSFQFNARRIRALGSCHTPAITPLCVRPSLSCDHSEDSMPIAPASSRRFSPIHF